MVQREPVQREPVQPGPGVAADQPGPGVAADQAGPGVAADQAGTGHGRTRHPLPAGLWHSLPAGLAFTRGAGRRASERAARARGNFSWPWQGAWVDLAWVLFSLANLVCILVFSRWETVPFHFIWISLTLLYGFRVWATRPTLWVLGVVMRHHVRRDQLGRLPSAPSPWTS